MAGGCTHHDSGRSSITSDQDLKDTARQRGVWKGFESKRARVCLLPGLQLLGRGTGLMQRAVSARQ
jgi:hypothetical protein